jgi:hypothetical protein
MELGSGDEARLRQQQLRWNLAYGPVRANALAAALRSSLTERSDVTIEELVAGLDPQPTPPADELAAPRW